MNKITITYIVLIIASLCLLTRQTNGQTCSNIARTTEYVPPSPSLTDPVPFPGLGQTSEFLNDAQYKMGRLFDPPRVNADCPHLQSGLVDWHNAAIWPGRVVPAAGASVVLPANSRVLVSNCSWPAAGFKRIEVPETSELIFNDQDATYNIRNIMVFGKFKIGVKTCRLYATINFNFNGGAGATDEIGPGFGSKGIGCSNTCSLDIHGKQYHATWTRLNAAASKGYSYLYLQDTVNWEVGQQIVIATSVFSDNNPATHQNEVRTITAIKSGNVIQLNAPLTYDHWAGAAYQPEVGLLSRRITFRGNPDANGVGGHIIIMGNGRVSGVNVEGMGQTNVLGRYPLHFHRTFECPTCSFTDNSATNTMFRCFVVHATNQSTVLRNVAYNAKGSCFYIEDGSEEKNIVMHNLAIHTSVIGTPAGGPVQSGSQFVSDATCLVPSDHAAAGFYITNPYNIFIGNAASGGWAAFTFPTLQAPLLTSRNTGQVPHRRPILRFEGNTAHSAGEYWDGSGPCIYVGGRIWEEYNAATSTWITKYDSGRGSGSNNKHLTMLDGEPTSLKFINTKLWQCRLGVLFWGERVESDGLEMHDTGMGAVVFEFGALKRLWLNWDTPAPTYASRHNGNLEARNGFQFYDTTVRIVIADSTFKNFNGNYRALESMSHSDVFKQQGINGVTKLNWINTPASNKIYHNYKDNGSSRHTNFLDFDGSLSGFGEPSYVGSIGKGLATDPFPSNWWKYRNDCSNARHSDWGMWVCKKGGDGVEVAMIQFYVPGVIYDTWTGGDQMLGSNHVATLSYFGSDAAGLSAGIPQRIIQMTRNPGVIGLTGVGGWYFNPNSGVLPKSINFLITRLPAYRSIILAISYSDATAFTVNRARSGGAESINLTPASSYAQMFDSDGSKYFYAKPHLFLKLGTPTPDDNYFQVDGVRLYDFDTNLKYTITATCPSATCKSPYQLPTASPVVPPMTGDPTAEDTVWPQPDMTAFWDRVFSATSGKDFDCVVSDWTAWSACSDVCTTNAAIPPFRQRTRGIIRKGYRNGFACPYLSETAPCNNQICTGPIKINSITVQSIPALATTGPMSVVVRYAVVSASTITTALVNKAGANVCSNTNSVGIGSGTLNVGLNCATLPKFGLTWKVLINGVAYYEKKAELMGLSYTLPLGNFPTVIPGVTGGSFSVTIDYVCKVSCNLRGDLYDGSFAWKGQAKAINNLVGTGRVNLDFVLTNSIVGVASTKIKVWLVTSENDKLYGSKAWQYNEQQTTWDAATNTKITSLPPCAVSAWGAWSACTAPCGGMGNKTRTRTITNGGSLVNPSVQCPPLIESEVCNTFPCVNSNCQWFPWGKWSDCSRTCGIGNQVRTRGQLPAVGTGTPCTGSATESRPCALDTYCSYTPFYTSNFAAGSTTGWTVNGLSVPATVTPCGNLKVIRQPTKNAIFSFKAASITATIRVSITVGIGYIDAWGTETGTIYVNGVAAWKIPKKVSQSTSGTQICGQAPAKPTDTWWYDNFSTFTFIHQTVVPMTSLQIEFRTDFSGDVGKQSLAISFLQVGLGTTPQ